MNLASGLAGGLLLIIYKRFEYLWPSLFYREFAHAEEFFIIFGLLIITLVLNVAIEYLIAHLFFKNINRNKLILALACANICSVLLTLLLDSLLLK